ncbi:hypothetical protein NXS19_001661 [Fusarium pseudograminearum]|nr:hypothetical protein NXS19_001661 [Fusarium pseudograminearum]
MLGLEIPTIIRGIILGLSLDTAFYYIARACFNAGTTLYSTYQSVPSTCHSFADDTSTLNQHFPANIYSQLQLRLHTARPPQSSPNTCAYSAQTYTRSTNR